MNSAGTFTIQFHQHLPRERWQHVLDSLQSAGAQIEQETSHQFTVLCERDSQITDIGCALFHTHFKSLANVVGVSGAARAEASAYPFPKTRAERKRYRG